MKTPAVKVGIASCLLGKNCRYNGKTKGIDLRSLPSHIEWCDFCPEDTLYGTPREPMSFFQTDNGLRLLTNETQRDLTDELATIAQQMAQEIKELEITHYLTKARSPSCGLHTPIVDSTATTAGLFAKELLKIEKLKVYEEDQLSLLLQGFLVGFPETDDS
jgi:uncharacterized protein YbbK (DUF523 family)